MMHWSHLVWLMTFAAGPAAAQEANKVFLDATFLGTPTDWCPATAGVPLVVTMDGPDIIEGPQDWPRTVRERVGGKLRITHSENTVSFGLGEDVVRTVIGRFSAEFEMCHSPWDNGRITGNWRLTGNDGAEMDSGAFEDRPVGSLYLPFFVPFGGRSPVQFANFGDRTLFTAPRPEVTTTQTFSAESDKE